MVSAERPARQLESLARQGRKGRTDEAETRGGVGELRVDLEGVRAVS